VVQRLTNVEEEVPDMKVNYFGLRLNKGVTVATFVTTAPVTRRAAFHLVSCTREVVSQ